MEYAETGQNAELLSDLDTYRRFCQLCVSEDDYRDEERWLDFQKHPDIDPLVLANPPRAALRPPLVVEVYAGIARDVLFESDDANGYGSVSLGAQPYYLTFEYGKCATPKERIGDAFLAALEAECPPPSWLLLE